MNGNRNCSAIGIDYINIAFIAKSNVLPSGEGAGWRNQRASCANDTVLATTISHNIEMIL
jgi:hypothetical protein